MTGRWWKHQTIPHRCRYFAGNKHLPEFLRYLEDVHKQGGESRWNPDQHPVSGQMLPGTGAFPRRKMWRIPQRSPNYNTNRLRHRSKKREYYHSDREPD